MENGLQYTDDGAVRPVNTTRGGAFYVGKPAQPVEVAKELVGSINEMNDHLG